MKNMLTAKNGLLRILHWNILTHHKENVLPQIERIDEFSQIIKLANPDFCCLLEVTASDHVDKIWEDATGLTYRSVPYEGRHHLALLARPDLAVDFKEFEIPSRLKNERHSAFIAESMIHGASIAIASVHVAWRIRHERLRKRQLRAVAEECLRYSNVILTSDTNALPWWPSRKALKHFGLSTLMDLYGNPGTFPSEQMIGYAYENPLQEKVIRSIGTKSNSGIWQAPIDDMYYKGVIPIRRQRVTGPSDHDGILADFAVQETAIRCN